MNRLSDRFNGPELDPNVLSILRHQFASMYNNNCPTSEEKIEMDNLTRKFINSQTKNPQKAVLYLREYRTFTGRRKISDTTVFLQPVN